MVDNRAIANTKPAAATAHLGHLAAGLVTAYYIQRLLALGTVERKKERKKKERKERKKEKRKKKKRERFS